MRMTDNFPEGLKTIFGAERVVPFDFSRRIGIEKKKNCGCLYSLELKITDEIRIIDEKLKEFDGLPCRCKSVKTNTEINV